MKTYKVSPEFINNKIARMILTRCFSCLFGTAVVIIFLGWKLADPINIFALSVMVLIFTVPYVVKSKKLQQSMLTYEIILDDEYIKRKQANSPDLEIRRAAIIDIQEDTNKGLIVKSSNAKERIAIPVGLENYEEVKSQLLNWREMNLVP